MRIVSFFSQDYREARDKFVEVALRHRAVTECFENPHARGPHREVLTTDVARFGDPGAPRLMVLLSATHGVEGFCGSGCQIGLMEEGIVTRPPPEVQVLVVHAVNPFGFAWLRRVNEDNIDLNRNSVDHDDPPPTNPDYLFLLPFLVPRKWHGRTRDSAEEAIAEFIRSRGERTFQAAVSGGQYSEPNGLFYGGTRYAWSTVMLRGLMARHAVGKTHVAMIDFHTGLGPSGYGEAIYAGNDDEELARVRRWYGSQVTSIHGGDSASAIVQGPLMNGMQDLLEDAEFTPLALEYGTLPISDVMNAMRAEQWLTLYGDPASDEGRQIKQRMRDCFYVDTDTWKAAVFERALDLTKKGLTGLAG